MSEPTMPYRITTHYPDPGRQLHAALHHMREIDIAHQRLTTHLEAIDLQIADLRDQIASLTALRSIAETDWMTETQHDRTAVATWLADTGLVGGRTKHADLGTYSLTTRRAAARTKLSVSDATLAELYPDLTRAVLSDRRAATARLTTTEDGAVIDSQTGALVPDASATISPATITTNLVVGRRTIHLATDTLDPTAERSEHEDV